jgi:hypothetical protein
VVIILAIYLFSLIIFVLNLEIFAWMIVIFSIFFYILIIPSILVSVVMIVHYCNGIFHNPKLNKSSKTLWVLGLVFLFFYTLPAYWYTFIRPELPARPPDFPQEE